MRRYREAQVVPHFTANQAVAVSRAIGFTLEAERQPGKVGNFTLTEIALLQEARLTLAGAMAISIDEERQTDATKAADV